jgi:hypothetical protein
MKPLERIKIVRQLVDLPIIDRDERCCGIVDDIELAGSAGKELRVKALLVGPGAYEGRMPSWMYSIVRRVCGDRVARVPVDDIAEIGSVVKLRSRAKDLGLHVVEDKVRRWIPRVGAF